MGYILYIQTPGHMYSTTQRWGGEYRRNVDSPSRVFFFGKVVPLHQLLLTLKGWFWILICSKFTIQHFRPFYLKSIFRYVIFHLFFFRNYDKWFKFKAILKIGNLNIQISYTKNITFLENCRHYKEDLITPYQDRFHTSLLHWPNIAKRYFCCSNDDKLVLICTNYLLLFFIIYNFSLFYKTVLVLW